MFQTSKTLAPKFKPLTEMVDSHMSEHEPTLTKVLTKLTNLTKMLTAWKWF